MVNEAQIRGIIQLKLWITLGGGILTLALYGQVAAISVLIGGGIAFLGSLVYALTAYGKNKYVAPVVLMKRHFLAEFIKMGLTLILFALTFIFFRQIAWPGLFAGYFLATMAYWLGLFFKFGE